MLLTLPLPDTHKSPHSLNPHKAPEGAVLAVLDRKIDLTRGADRDIPYTAKVRRQALHFRRLPLARFSPSNGFPYLSEFGNFPSMLKP